MTEGRCTALNRAGFDCRQLLFKLVAPFRLEIKCGRCGAHALFDVDPRTGAIMPAGAGARVTAGTRPLPARATQEAALGGRS